MTLPYAVAFAAGILLANAAPAPAAVAPAIGADTVPL